MPQHIVWQLSPSEKALAIEEGERRQNVNVSQGKIGRDRGPTVGDDALRVHILGAGGEMAVASYLGLKQFIYKEKEATRGSYDLPPDIDVKTRARHYYDLACFLDESPEKTLVLVTIEHQEIRLHGWIKAAHAKQEQWKKSHVPGRVSYFVPKEALRPMEELRQCLAAQTSLNTPFD
jgi:hypothetical protein